MDANSNDDSGLHPLTAAFARLSRTYELILHATGEGIFSLDLEGRITFANTAAARLLQWPAEELLGRTAAEVIHGGTAPGRPDPFTAPTAAGGARQRDHFLTRGGDSLAVEYSLAQIHDDDACIGAVLVFGDISERERAERALRETNVLLNESNERLSTTRDQLLQAEKLAAIGQLAAGVAHEVNTPLGFIGANVSTLGRNLNDLLALVATYEAAGCDGAGIAEARRRCDLEFLREDAPALVRETGEGLAKVAGIVRELREFANAGESGEWQWSELPRLLDGAVAAAAARVDGGARIERDYAELPQIYCLAVRLGQAFTSIVVNALQAVARDGCVTLRARPGPAAGEVTVVIEDNGIGIPAEHLARVRDPFFTTRPVGSGTGMGLSVADTTVRRHGGRLDIESEAGVGTRVTVVLPLRPKAG